MSRDATEPDVVLDSATNKESSSSRPGTRHQSGNISYMPSAAMLQEISGMNGQHSGGTGSIPTSNERGVSVTVDICNTNVLFGLYSIKLFMD